MRLHTMAIDNRELIRLRQAWIAFDGVGEALEMRDYETAESRLESLRDHVADAKAATNSAATDD